jgi:hypothetical protein
LYQLKQDYGFPVTLIKVLQEETNSATGNRVVQRDILQIKKAVDLPAETARRFWYDMAYIKANTNFTYGAEVDVKSKQIVIDKRDLKSKKITERDFIMIRHERFEIFKVYDLEHDLGYLLSLKLAEGSIPYDSIQLFANSNLQIYGVSGGII